jgi:hypothetical protein
LTMARTFASLFSGLQFSDPTNKLCLGTVLMILLEFIKYHQASQVTKMPYQTTYDKNILKQLTLIVKVMANPKFVKDGTFGFSQVLTVRCKALR